jgi:hypothetical protein
MADESQASGSGMRVFISWSGPRSRAVAEALRDWLPDVVQGVQPWLSSQDIDPGARWGTDIAAQLADTHYGVLCLTRESQNAPWLLFEAGALSKHLTIARVCPYLFEMRPADLQGPLAQFQALRADEQETLRLVHGINDARPLGRLSREQLDKAFKMWWPELEAKLKAVPPLSSREPETRSDRSILEEILLLVRQRPVISSTTVRRTQDPAVAAVLREWVRDQRLKYGGDAGVLQAIISAGLDSAITVSDLVDSGESAPEA